MNRLIISIFLFLSIILASCSSDPNSPDEPDNPTLSGLTLSESEITVSGFALNDESVVRILSNDEVVSDNIEVSVHYPQGETEDWLKARQQNGNIYVHPISACEDEPRKAYVDIKYGKLGATLSVHQPQLKTSDSMKAVLERELYEYLQHKGFGTNGSITYADVKAITDLGDLIKTDNDGSKSYLRIQNFSIFKYFKNLRILGDGSNDDTYLAISHFYIGKDCESNIDLSVVPLLESISIDTDKRTVNNLDKLSNLKKACIYRYNSDMLDFSPLVHLEELIVDFDGFDKGPLTLPKGPLRKIVLANFNFSELDISQTQLGMTDDTWKNPNIDLCSPTVDQFTLWLGQEQWDRYIANKFYPNISIRGTYRAVRLKDSTAPQMRPKYFDSKPWTIYSELYIDNDPNPKIKWAYYTIYSDEACSNEVMRYDASYNDGKSLEDKTPFYQPYPTDECLKENTPYYAVWTVKTEDRIEHRTEPYAFKTPPYIEPRYHVEEITKTKTTARIKIVADILGNYSLNSGKSKFCIGTTPNFSLDQAVGMDDGGWRIGSNYIWSGNIENLQPGTQYYAKAFLEFEGGDRTLSYVTEPVSFMTEATPPPPEPTITVGISEFSCRRQRYNYVGNGITQYESLLKATAYYNPSDLEGFTYYFETNDWGNYGADITSPGKFSTSETVVWYWNMSTQPKPEMKIRAVIEYKDKKYTSEWKSWSM